MSREATLATADRHVLKSDLRPKMAKASLSEVKKIDPEALKLRVGHAVRRTRGELSQKEFADLIGRDQSQVVRWEKGEDRPQLDAILAVPSLQGRLVEELAALADDVEIVTTISIRRRRTA